MNREADQSGRMPSEPMEQRLALIARDFAELYRELTKLHLLAPHSLSVDAFQAVFDRMNMEYLHYAGSSATEPFHLGVVRSVLQLATGYLSLPVDVSPNGRAFGMYLLFFLYWTQPTIDTSPVKIRVSLATLQSYVEDVETSVNQAAAAPQLGRHVTDGERRLLLALHRAGAWHVVPFSNISLHLRALLNAHEVKGVPLVTSSGTSQQQQTCLVKTLGGDAELSKQLEKYEAMRQKLGIDGLLCSR